LAWVLWAVIAVFVLLVFVDFGPAVPGAQVGGNVAASLGPHEVTWHELQRQHQTLQDQMRSIYQDQWSDELARQLQLERRALDQLFNNKILAAEARELGLTVSDDEVRKEILRSFQNPDGSFIGQETYERWTSNQFGSPAAFEELVREELLLTKLQSILLQTVYVSDEDVERAYRQDVERAAIRYLLLPGARFAEEARADRASLQGYYQEHQEEYRLPEQRRVDYVMVDQGLLRAQLEVPEEELRAYFEEHPEEFTREEQVQARHILLRTDKRSVEEARAGIAAARSRIEGGEDFAAVAREVSEDPGSAARGGDLGFFGRGRMVPAFEEAAFGARPGELVGPVESDFGVHLLEVTERREGGRIPFDEARETVRARLASERLEEEATERALEVRNRLAEAPEGELRARMEALAQEDPVLRFETTAPFGEGDVIPGIGRSPELTGTAFSLEAGELAESVVSAPRGPMVVRLAEVLPERVPPLSEVEERVRQEVERQRREDLAEARLQELRSEVAAGSLTLEEAASSLEVELVETPEFGGAETIQGLGFAPAVRDAALAAEEGELVGPLSVPQGSLLFEVTARQGFDPEELARRRDEIRERVAQERATQLLSSLILERRRQEGGIVPSRELQEQLGAAATGAG
ncbi:MAG TPA: peptidyl-prolyl cis-trans isomerase, partial [Thermoanaerobaculia bacterium]